MKLSKKELEFIVDKIDELVNNDFVSDMESRRYEYDKRKRLGVLRSDNPVWNDEEADKLTKLLSSVYALSHTNTCTACRKTLSSHLAENL